MKHYLTSALFIFSFSFLPAQTPHWQWARGATGQYQEGTALGVDPTDGSVIAGGYYQDTVDFNGIILTSENSAFAGFIVKYDATGQRLWAANVGGTTGENTFVLGISVDLQGNIAVCGLFTSAYIVFGADTLFNLAVNGYDFFIARYDRAGNFLWARTATGNFNESWPGGVSFDARGRIWITGHYWGSAPQLGSFTLPASLYQNAPSVGYFIAVYDTSGNVLMAQAPAGQNYSYGIAVSANLLDPEGTVYATGYFESDTLKLDNIVLINSDTLLTTCTFIAQYDSTGSVVWAKNTGGNGTPNAWNSYPTAISADKSGNAYVTGAFTGQEIVFDQDTMFYAGMMTGANVFIAKYNAAGNVKWGKIGRYTNNGSGEAIAADTLGNLYVSVSFSDTLLFDTLTMLAPFNATDPLAVLKCDTNGNVVFSSVLASGGDDQSGLGVDNFGDAYVSGDYEAQTFIIGPDTLANEGLELDFTAKLVTGTCTTSTINITPDGEVICSGDSVQLCAPGGFASYQWNSGQTTQCFYTSATGNYYLTATVGNGCIAISDKVSIGNYAPVPVIIHQSGDTLICTNSGPYQWFINGAVIPGANDSIYVAQTQGTYTVQITDQHGCNDLSLPVVTGITGLLPENTISIFPNPSIGSWQLAVGNEFIGAVIEVCNTPGQIVFQSKIENPISQIHLPNISSGIYELRIISPQGIFIRKLVKM